MTNIYKINGCRGNAEKIFKNLERIADYHVPLESYRDKEECLSQEFGMDISIENINMFREKCKEISKQSVYASKYDSLDDFLDSMISKYCFYLAAQPLEDGLIWLIKNSNSDYTAKRLEKIMFADFSSINNLYSSRFLMLTADALAGMYSFHTVRNFSRAMELYTKVIERQEPSGKFKEIAEKRIQCCELLSASPYNLPNETKLKAIEKNANTDNFSSTVLAFYYLTTPEIRSEVGNRERGMHYLNNALYKNYRPAFFLFQYLGRMNVIKKFDENRFNDFLYDHELPIIEHVYFSHS
jgi:hypothetical protein